MLGFEYGYSLDCPDGAGAVGGAVRRLRQRGAGDHRPVHRQRRGQVAAAERAWCCCCRTASRGRGPSTPAPGSSASWRWPPRTTSRSSTRPRRRSTSTCCAGRCCGRWRKPLVVMTPKSLLRHPQAVSPLDELADGRVPARHARRRRRGRRASTRVLLCTRQDLLRPGAASATSCGRERRGDPAARAALPAADEALLAALEPYPDGHAGGLGAGRAGEHGRLALPARALRRAAARPLAVLAACARAASASPATGSAASHKLEQQQLLERAFGEVRRRAGQYRSVTTIDRTAYGPTSARNDDAHAVELKVPRSASRSPKSQIGALAQAAGRAASSRTSRSSRSRPTRRRVELPAPVAGVLTEIAQAEGRDADGRRGDRLIERSGRAGREAASRRGGRQRRAPRRQTAAAGCRAAAAGRRAGRRAVRHARRRARAGRARPRRRAGDGHRPRRPAAEGGRAARGGRARPGAGRAAAPAPRRRAARRRPRATCRRRRRGTKKSCR